MGEYFLTLDKNNFDDEMKYHLFNNDINRADLLDLLGDGFISIQQYIDYVDYLDYLEDIDVQFKW